MVCVNTKFITEITEDYNLFNLASGRSLASGGDLKLGGEWKAFFMLRGEECGEVVLELKYGDDKIEIAKDKVVVTVADIDLRTDLDRDGTVEFDSDDDKTTGFKPWRFWINNDCDLTVKILYA